MHPDTLRMYLNVIQTTLTKENWKKYKELFDKDENAALFFVKLYHRLGRDKEKFNKAFELITTDKEIKEFNKLVDKQIELLKKKIEKLEKLRKYTIIKLVEKKVK